MFSVFGSFQDRHDAAFGTGDGAFEEQQVVFSVYFDNFNFGDGVRRGTVVTSHTLTGQYFTQRTAGSQTTGSSFSIRGTVGGRLTGKAVAFYNTLESFTL